MQILTRFNKIIAYSDSKYIPVGSTAVCTATGEKYDDVLITDVDCIPTDIDAYEYYYINGKFVKGCSNSEIRETNAQEKLQFWVGTTAEFEALTKKYGNVLYILSDDDTLGELVKVLNGERYVPAASIASKADNADYATYATYVKGESSKGTLSKRLKALEDQTPASDITVQNIIDGTTMVGKAETAENAQKVNGIEIIKEGEKWYTTTYTEQLSVEIYITTVSGGVGRFSLNNATLPLIAGETLYYNNEEATVEFYNGSYYAYAPSSGKWSAESGKTITVERRRMITIPQSKLVTQNVKLEKDGKFTLPLENKIYKMYVSYYEKLDDNEYIISTHILMWDFNIVSSVITGKPFSARIFRHIVGASKEVNLSFKKNGDNMELGSNLSDSSEFFYITKLYEVIE